MLPGTMPKKRTRGRRVPETTAVTHAPKDVAKAQAHVRGILQFLGEDPEREGLLDTPARVVRALGEHFSGYAQDPASFLARTFQEDGYDQLVLVSDIEIFSHCEH